MRLVEQVSTLVGTDGAHQHSRIRDLHLPVSPTAAESGPTGDE